MNAKNSLEAWKKSMETVIEFGKEYLDIDKRKCREVTNLIVTIENTEDCEKPLDLMRSFEWIYPTAEDLSSILFNKEINTTYEYSYGPRIFNFGKKKDQINNFIIPLLKKNPESRRAVISLFDPVIDSDLNNDNIISWMFMQFKIKDGKLNISGFLRSNDCFIGWPADIYQMSLIQKYVAEKLNIQPGSLTLVSGSAHLFEDNMDDVKKILSRIKLTGSIIN